MSPYSKSAEDLCCAFQPGLQVSTGSQRFQLPLSGHDSLRLRGFRASKTSPRGLYRVLSWVVSCVSFQPVLRGVFTADLRVTLRVFTVASQLPLGSRALCVTPASGGDPLWLLNSSCYTLPIVFGTRSIRSSSFCCSMLPQLLFFLQSNCLSCMFPVGPCRSRFPVCDPLWLLAVVINPYYI